MSHLAEGFSSATCATVPRAEALRKSKGSDVGEEASCWLACAYLENISTAHT